MCSLHSEARFENVGYEQFDFDQVCKDGQFDALNAYIEKMSPIIAYFNYFLNEPRYSKSIEFANISSKALERSLPIKLFGLFGSHQHLHDESSLEGRVGHDGGARYQHLDRVQLPIVGGSG